MDVLCSLFKWQMQLQLGLIYVYPKPPDTCPVKWPRLQ